MSTPRIINGLDELKTLVGKEVATSDWLLVDQARIQAFADVTDDHQWIHLDVERCQRELPYKAPIAHGYLILSLIPMLFASSLRIDGLAMTVNYGLDRVRLPAPVIAGQRIRGHLALEKLDDVKGGMQAHWAVSVEVEGADKPACVAQMLARYHPQSQSR
ncbi:MAG TPA: MaoC family dehydratase [Dokdonella sp.]|uniref:MaoC family dehydratase n=1 Tax=Dokdonella sp. TaxID=2291710 RepID=UPI002D808212|nr:MaoC family dehydratase [Dokdonella sp.]HET9033219.1 MaoC family dehydratase [Dokdonella sp.]